MDFSRLATALDGNAALQRRARLAAFSFAVLGLSLIHISEPTRPY